jgi:N-acetylglucosaminyl-diphospho-decaprenol L-rhamnosyltransferase
MPVDSTSEKVDRSGQETRERRQSYILAIVVTYKSTTTFTLLLPAVREWLAGDLTNRLVVFDNSDDMDLVKYAREQLSEHADRSICSANYFNSGFALGVNTGYSLAMAKWGRPKAVVLLNPDIATSSSTIAHVVSDLGTRGVGVAAPKLITEEGFVDHGSMRRRWNMRRLIADTMGIPAGAIFLLTRRRAVEPRANATLIDVDITSGAFMAIAGEVFGDGLDTRMPMYLEDQEICHRAIVKGYRVVVDQRLTAEHVGGVSRKRNSDSQRWLRVAELALAPSISLADWSDSNSIWRGRLAVLIGGLIRLAMASLAFGASMVGGRDRGWAAEQARLSSWLIHWALVPSTVERDRGLI